MLISVISDTHLPSIFRNPDGLGPELGEFLSQTDLIIHAGDVVRPSILDWCEQFAPVRCAKGNNDEFDDITELEVYYTHGIFIEEDEPIINAEIITAPYVIIPTLGERLDFQYSFPSNSRDMYPR